MKAYPYAQRERKGFHQTGEFKTRIIELPPDGAMPECRMSSHVIFLVLEGQARVRVNGEEAAVHEKRCLITEPAILSMNTDTGVRLLGIQITKA